MAASRTESDESDFSNLFQPRNRIGPAALLQRDDCRPSHSRVVVFQRSVHPLQIFVRVADLQQTNDRHLPPFGTRRRQHFAELFLDPRAADVRQRVRRVGAFFLVCAADLLHEIVDAIGAGSQ